MKPGIKKFLAALWDSTKTYLLDILKEKFIKLALKKFLGSAAGAGFQTWLVTFIATELYEEIAEPVAKAVLVEAEYSYHKVEGKVLIKRMKEAGNVEDYNNSVDDILS